MRGKIRDKSERNALLKDEETYEKRLDKGIKKGVYGVKREKWTTE